MRQKKILNTHFNLVVGYYYKFFSTNIVLKLFQYVAKITHITINCKSVNVHDPLMYTFYFLDNKTESVLRFIK